MHPACMASSNEGPVGLKARVLFVLVWGKGKSTEWGGKA